MLYKDGERRYILAPKVCQLAIKSNLALTHQLKWVTHYQCVISQLVQQYITLNSKPGKGGQIARSADAYVQIIAREGQLRNFLRLRSGEMRKVLAECCYNR